MAIDLRRKKRKKGEKDSFMLCPYCLEYRKAFVLCEGCGIMLCEDCSIVLFKDAICLDCFPNEIHKAIYPSHRPDNTGMGI